MTKETLVLAFEGKEYVLTWVGEVPTFKYVHEVLQAMGAVPWGCRAPYFCWVTSTWTGRLDLLARDGYVWEVAHERVEPFAIEIEYVRPWDQAVYVSRRFVVLLWFGLCCVLGCFPPSC